MHEVEPEPNRLSTPDPHARTHGEFGSLLIHASFPLWLLPVIMLCLRSAKVARLSGSRTGLLLRRAHHNHTKVGPSFQVQSTRAHIQLCFASMHSNSNASSGNTTASALPLLLGMSLFGWTRDEEEPDLAEKHCITTMTSKNISDIASAQSALSVHCAQ